MSSNRNSTNRPRHQGGPVTKAIRAVREAVTPWFVSVQAAEPMQAGFHVGRRHDWTDSGRQELVWLDALEHDGEWTYAVFRCGSRKAEHPGEWEFTLRVGGIRSMPEEPIDLTATRH